MPIPNSMKLIMKEGEYSLEIGLTKDEYEILSILGYRDMMNVWVPWQAKVESFKNDPDNQSKLEEKRKELAETLNKKQAKLGESIDNSEHFRIMQQAYEEAGRNGLTDEELKESCIRIQYPGAAIPPESARSGWDNRHRSMRKKFSEAEFIIDTGDRRPTHSSRARHLAQGIEPRGVARVWRIRNLPLTEDS